MFALKAPAKINLTLEVLGKRRDGYHEVSGVIQAISLSDVLEFQASDSFSFTCDNPEWDGSKSLVSRAAYLFAEHTGASQGASIRIKKNIPFSAGLGGESSAAAITLIGLNHLFKTELSPGKLFCLAEKLGCDVPFFLTGGTALISGKGEKVSPLPSLPRHWVILLAPTEMGAQRKTEKMYSFLEPGDYTTGASTDSLISSLTLGKTDTLPDFYNAFEEVAGEVFGNICWYRDQLYLAGAKRVTMSGSGPVLFSLEKDKSQAEQIVQRLSESGLKAMLAHTIENTGFDIID